MIRDRLKEGLKSVQTCELEHKAPYEPAAAALRVRQPCNSKHDASSMP